jgi:hypothetical protein
MRIVGTERTSEPMKKRVGDISTNQKLHQSAETYKNKWLK